MSNISPLVAENGVFRQVRQDETRKRVKKRVKKFGKVEKSLEIRLSIVA
jgi:cell division protein FtsL